MTPCRVGEILFSEEQIRNRVAELIDEIEQTCDPDNLLFVGILRGSFIFLADLVRELGRRGLHPAIDFITLASYGDRTESSGVIEIRSNPVEPLEGKDLLLVDDILDSGRTLAFAREWFLEQGARSVKTCVLLDKTGRRAIDFTPDYSGFEIDDLFVIGYGLDCAGHFRELPYIACAEFTPRP